MTWNLSMTAMLRPGTLNFSIKSCRESIIRGLFSSCGITAVFSSICRMRSALPDMGVDCWLAAGAIHAVRAAANTKPVVHFVSSIEEDSLPVVHFVSSIEGDSFRPGRGNDTRLYDLLDDEVPRLAN